MTDALPAGTYRIVFSRTMADPDVASLGGEVDRRPGVLLYDEGAGPDSDELGVVRLGLPVPVPDAENGSLGVLEYVGPSSRARLRVAGQVVPLPGPPRPPGHTTTTLGEQLRMSNIAHPRHAGTSVVAAWVRDPLPGAGEQPDADVEGLPAAMQNPVILVGGLVALIAAAVGWTLLSDSRAMSPFLLILITVAAFVVVERVQEAHRRQTAVEARVEWREGPHSEARVAVWWSPDGSAGVIPWLVARVDDRLLSWPVVGAATPELLDGPYDAVVLGDVTAQQPWLGTRVGALLLEPVDRARSLQALGFVPTEAKPLLP